MGAGIQSVVGRYSVDETVARLETLLQEKGVKLFCVVDHSGEAAAAGLKMPATKLLIFGNPAAGDASDAGCAERGAGPAAEDTGRRRGRRENHFELE